MLRWLHVFFIFLKCHTMVANLSSWWQGRLLPKNWSQFVFTLNVELWCLKHHFKTWCVVCFDSHSWLLYIKWFWFWQLYWLSKHCSLYFIHQYKKHPFWIWETYTKQTELVDNGVWGTTIPHTGDFNFNISCRRKFYLKNSP